MTEDENQYVFTSETTGAFKAKNVTENNFKERL